MLWFEKLMGFAETSPEQVQQNIRLDGPRMTSLVNGKTYRHGQLEIASLSALREQTKAHPPLGKMKPSGQNALRAREVIGDVQDFHLWKENKGALFQAASQFNLLEMVNPTVRPEDGVGRYQYDRTQGPACAIACGAGTIYRNYFVPVGDCTGQASGRQVDCLDALGDYFHNEKRQLWQVKNGYAFANEAGLHHIRDNIQSLSPQEYEELKGYLKVGIQWDTEVTIDVKEQLVSQIYCSALPVQYSSVASEHWEAFARLILEATYEASFHAALLNCRKTGNPKLYLTLVGGGVFGNEEEWIAESILSNLARFAKQPLEVYFVSYGRSNPLVQQILARARQAGHL